MAEERVVLKSREDGVVVLTLNRPDRANALSAELLDTLYSEVQELRHDASVRAVILTGAGEKAFSAGADLKERKGMPQALVERAVLRIQDTVNAIAALPMPVIAAINGVAFGGGTELALAADLRIAAASAKMGLTETSLAIIPGAGGTQRLARIVGISKAKELIFTARRIDALTAQSIGLVNQVVEDGQVLTAATELAAEISANGPIAVRQAKFAIDQGFDTDLKTGLMIERKAYEVIIPTEDRLEGLQAFAEKRKPNYQGR